MYVNLAIVLFMVSVLGTQAFFIRVSNPLEDRLTGANVKEHELLTDISHTRDNENSLSRHAMEYARPVEDDEDESDIGIHDIPAKFELIDGNSEDVQFIDDIELNSINRPKINTVGENADGLLRDDHELMNAILSDLRDQRESENQLLLEFLVAYCAEHPDCDDTVLADLS